MVKVGDIVTIDYSFVRNENFKGLFKVKTIERCGTCEQNDCPGYVSLRNIKTGEELSDKCFGYANKYIIKRSRLHEYKNQLIESR